MGLDAQTRRKVWDLYPPHELGGGHGFLTTHYIEEAEALCQRIGVLHHGRMIAIGSPLSLRQKLGMIAVEMHLNGNGTQYKYFPDRARAAEFIQTLPSTERVVMRESNLEDVFIELTGQKVMGGLE